MACCGDREKNQNQVPNLSGEIRIWNEDGSITTIPLNDLEIWTLRAVMKESHKRAVNEHGWCNGASKAVIITLDEKINAPNKFEGPVSKGGVGVEPTTPPPPPPKGQGCGCSHE